MKWNTKHQLLIFTVISSLLVLLLMPPLPVMAQSPTIEAGTTETVGITDFITRKRGWPRWKVFWGNSEDYEFLVASSTNSNGWAIWLLSHQKAVKIRPPLNAWISTPGRNRYRFIIAVDSPNAWIYGNGIFLVR